MIKNIVFDNVVIPKYNLYGKFIRNTRSFVCRSGRHRKKNIDIIKKYWSYFGLNFQCQSLDIHKIFDNKNRFFMLDIGFGKGESLLHTASYNLDKNILGIEIYVSGISYCMHNMYMANMKNVKIILHDAEEVLQYMICDNSVDVIHVFFPDPWIKLRHNKRRILKPDFIKLLARKQVKNGILYIVTDCKIYANYIMSVINSISEYTSRLNNIDYLTIFNSRIVTNFEKKANILNKKIFNLLFQCSKL